MGNPHILAIPFPAQGHVIPLLELSHRLIKLGLKVTFLNTEYNHERVLSALPDHYKDCLGDKLSLVSVPDGLEDWEDRSDLGKVLTSILKVMPGMLEDLIEKNERSSGENGKITCVIADRVMGWALKVAAKMGIPRAALSTTPAAMTSLAFSIPVLIERGIIDENGTPSKQQMIELAPNMPAMNTTQFAWCWLGDMQTQITAFNMAQDNIQSVKLADWILCNSAYDLEPGAFTYSPNIQPVGPLLASDHPIGSFWPEETSCLSWLDQQPSKSVIYIAFGSLAKVDRTQFREFALGLELTNMPFLWAVRPGLLNEANDAYPDGFRERVAFRGHLVSWSPQPTVLSHPSVACFVTHCGWNSVLEGIINGVPFLCWPYFADHFMIESYICGFWKVGMRFDKDESGIVSREEIKSKVKSLVGDHGIKKRAMELKDTTLKSVSEDGQSSKVFNDFVDWVKAQTRCI